MSTFLIDNLSEYQDYRTAVAVGVILQHLQFGSSVSLPPMLTCARDAAALAAATKDSIEAVGSLSIAEADKAGLANKPALRVSARDGARANNES